MKIAINLMDGCKAYYRKQGSYCFDFVTDPDMATDLTAAEVDAIVSHADWYCKQYGATHITAE